MRIETEVKLDFKDVLIRPKRSTLKSRSEVDLVRTYTFKHSKKTISCIPIIAANMDTTGRFCVAKALSKHKLITAVHKHYTPEEWAAFASEYTDLTTTGVESSPLDYMCVSAGTSDADWTRVSQILSQQTVPFICLDVANGYSEFFVDTVRKYREAYDEATIIAGNVVTGEMTEELILTGADIVKVGIGPGSVCTTRKKTGVGYPQLSAVIECSDAAHGLGGLIVSDGGAISPGCIAKAFGAGSDFTMLGGMFAGHDQSGGDIIEVKNSDGTISQFKEFYGMSSALAMTRHHGGVAEYRASEGKVVRCPYRGDINATVLDILGGLRSACTYVGASTLKDLSKRTTFIRVTQQTNDIFGVEKN